MRRAAAACPWFGGRRCPRTADELIGRQVGELLRLGLELLRGELLDVVDFGDRRQQRDHRLVPLGGCRAEQVERIREDCTEHHARDWLRRFLTQPAAPHPRKGTTMPRSTRVRREQRPRASSCGAAARCTASRFAVCAESSRGKAMARGKQRTS
eukprot:7376799-Prymnesium_polylepis.2